MIAIPIVQPHAVRIAITHPLPAVIRQLFARAVRIAITHPLPAAMRQFFARAVRVAVAQVAEVQIHPRHQRCLPAVTRRNLERRHYVRMASHTHIAIVVQIHPRRQLCTQSGSRVSAGSSRVSLSPNIRQESAKNQVRIR